MEDDKICDMGFFFNFLFQTFFGWLIQIQI